MVQRTIIQDRIRWNDTESDYGGHFFKKVQKGDDWPTLPKPVKVSEDATIQLARTALGKLTSVKGRLVERLRVHWELNAEQKRALRRELNQLRVQIRDHQAILEATRNALSHRNVQRRLVLAESRRLRKEENHDYDMTLSVRSRGFGNIRDSNGNVRWEQVSLTGLCGFSTANLEWSSNDSIALTNKLMGQISSGVDFQAAGALADVDRTVRMIGDSAKKLARSLKKASKGDLAGASRLLVNTKNSSSSVGSIRSSATGRQKWLAQGSSVRDRYLQYQFGIKPLVKDVEAAARAAAWLTDRPIYQKVSAVRKLTEKFVESRGFGTRCSVERTITARAVAILKTQPPAADALGLTDIPSFLWERGFLSFVVDWWIPIGNWLQALQAKRALETAFTVQTVVKRTSLTLEPEPGTGWEWDQNAPNTEYYVELSRRCGVGVSVPLPNFKPLFHKDTEVRVRHALESIALIHFFAEKTIQRRDRDLAAEARQLKRARRSR